MSNRLIYTSARAAIDLRYRHFERTKAGIIFIGTWLQDGNRSQPCLAMLNAARDIRPGKTIPCIIALDQVWRWAMHGDIGDPEHCGRVIRLWMESGALPGNAASGKDRLHLWAAINECLTELINMPPMPVKEQKVVGEAYKRNLDTGELIPFKELKQNA